MKQLFFKLTGTDDLLINLFASVYLSIIVLSLICLGIESANDPSMIESASYPI